MIEWSSLAPDLLAQGHVVDRGNPVIHNAACQDRLLRKMLAISECHMLVVNTAAQGAWPTALAATADGVKGGQYFGPGGRGELSGPARQVDSSAASKDPEKGRQLWDLSIEMTGVDPGI